MTSMRFVGQNGWNQCVKMWSAHLEFLKGRWRILKARVQIYGVDSVDYIWFTCCALHNWLLEIDGMNEIWVGGVHTVVSDWDGKMAGFDWESVRADIPTTLAHLSVNLDARNYD